MHARFGGLIASLARLDQALKSEHGRCDGESDLKEKHPHAPGLGRILPRLYRRSHTSTDTSYIARGQNYMLRIHISVIRLSDYILIFGARSCAFCVADSREVIATIKIGISTWAVRFGRSTCESWLHGVVATRRSFCPTCSTHAS